MTDDIRDAVRTMVDIEADLQAVAEPGVATPAVADADSGTVVGAERVAHDAVPDGYPVAVEGEQALALEIELDFDTTAVVFLNWPDGGKRFDHVDLLLDATGVSFDAFADIYGEEIPLAVREGFVVADLDYDRTSWSTAASGDDDPGTDATASRSGDPRGSKTGQSDGESDGGDEDQAVDDTAVNQVVPVSLLSLWVTWFGYRMLVTGFGVANIVAWGLGALGLFGAVASDRSWVNATTDATLARWWEAAVPLVPPLAAPVYLLGHHLAVRESSPENTNLASVHRTDADLGTMVSHHDGASQRIVVLDGGVCVQSLDGDPHADEGATYSYGEVGAITNQRDTGTTDPQVTLHGLPGSRERLTVEYPTDAPGDQAETAEALRRRKRIWHALRSVDADPETLAAAGSVVALLTADAVHLVREDDEDATIPLDRIGEVGLDYEGTGYRTPFAFFEDKSRKAASDRVEKVYCANRKAEFRTFVENVADRADVETTIEDDPGPRPGASTGAIHDAATDF